MWQRRRLRQVRFLCVLFCFWFTMCFAHSKTKIPGHNYIPKCPSLFILDVFTPSDLHYYIHTGWCLLLQTCTTGWCLLLQTCTTGWCLLLQTCTTIRVDSCLFYRFFWSCRVRACARARVCVCVCVCVCVYVCGLLRCLGLGLS